MAKPATATNTFDPDVVNNLLNKVDSFHADLESERGSYMAKCRNIRDSIEGVIEEGKSKGVPTKELKTLIKIRLLEAQAKRRFLELEADQQITLQMIAATERVADLPLWRSAAERKPMPGVDVDAPRHPKPMFN